MGESDGTEERGEILVGEQKTDVQRQRGGQRGGKGKRRLGPTREAEPHRETGGAPSRWSVRLLVLWEFLDDSWKNDPDPTAPLLQTAWGTGSPYDKLLGWGFRLCLAWAAPGSPGGPKCRISDTCINSQTIQNCPSVSHDSQTPSDLGSDAQGHQPITSPHFQDPAPTEWKQSKTLGTSCLMGLGLHA